MGVQISVSVELTTINCGVCSGTYAINESYREKKQRDAGGWNCPYCQCSWGYFGKTEAQKLRDELAREKQKAEQAQAEARSQRDLRLTQQENFLNKIRAEKGAKTRLKNRIANGVCPCCTRTFQNLHRHIETKHPEYKEANP